jgi:transcriptional regulator GlxA family with amidase domain
MLPNFIPKGVAHVAVANAAAAVPMTFVLLPNFSLIAFSSAIEPLRIANQLSGQALFEWEVLSETGAPVRCSNGLTVAVDRALGETKPKSMVFVCAGVEPEKSASRRVSDWVRQQWRSGRTVGGLCTGAYALAKAGILEGRSFTLHWENLPPFVETFDHLTPKEQLYCIDDRILTCAGGAAATDLFIEIVARNHGERLADAVLKMCLHGQQRPADMRQRSSVSSTIGIRNPILVSVIRAFEENIETGVEMLDVARQLGVSRRQIERLFQRYVRMSPKQYLNGLRLERARGLLSETDMAVSEVAYTCGFNNTNTFSKAFRQKFGVSPGKLSTMQASDARG